jgi:hypothetical protein
MFPNSIDLTTPIDVEVTPEFKSEWQFAMNQVCHKHGVWNSIFADRLKSDKTDELFRFNLAATWSVNMLSGSYCFPRYVCALAARAEYDVTRYGLIENAWDEAGSYGHTARSHFWLAVELSRLLGLSNSDIGRVRALPESQHYTDEHYRKCAEGDFDFALGMICLIEEFTTPEFTMIFKAFLRSCERGMANIADDERHREEMPRIVAALLKLRGIDLNDSQQISQGLGSVRAGAAYSSDLREKFFQGIYGFVESGNTYRDLIQKA